MRANFSPVERRHTAQTALQALSVQRDEHLLCSVRCSRSHHVTAVYDTAPGSVYEALTGPHAHGRRDFIDTATDRLAALLLKTPARQCPSGAGE